MPPVLLSALTCDTAVAVAAPVAFVAALFARVASARVTTAGIVLGPAVPLARCSIKIKGFNVYNKGGFKTRIMFEEISCSVHVSDPPCGYI